MAAKGSAAKGMVSQVRPSAILVVSDIFLQHIGNDG